MMVKQLYIGRGILICPDRLVVSFPPSRSQEALKQPWRLDDRICLHRCEVYRMLLERLGNRISWQNHAIDNDFFSPQQRALGKMMFLTCTCCLSVFRKHHLLIFWLQVIGQILTHTHTWHAPCCCWCFFFPWGCFVCKVKFVVSKGCWIAYYISFCIMLHTNCRLGTQITLELIRKDGIFYDPKVESTTFFQVVGPLVCSWYIYHITIWFKDFIGLYFWGFLSNFRTLSLLTSIWALNDGVIPTVGC